MTFMLCLDPLFVTSFSWHVLFWLTSFSNIEWCCSLVSLSENLIYIKQNAQNQLNEFWPMMHLPPSKWTPVNVQSIFFSCCQRQAKGCFLSLWINTILYLWLLSLKNALDIIHIVECVNSVFFIISGCYSLVWIHYNFLM